MRELVPGVFHWTTPHPRIKILVSSYWLDGAGVLLDPLVPPDVGLEWFAGRPTPPQAVLLTNRHHYRDSARFAEAFGVGYWRAHNPGQLTGHLRQALGTRRPGIVEVRPADARPAP